MSRKPGYSIRAAAVLAVAAYTYYQFKNLYVACATAGAILLIKPCAKQYAKWRRKKKYLNSSLSIIDQMDGHEFEEYLETHFKSIGYKVKNVGSGGRDYGVDLIIQKNGEKIAVQAKRYNSNVGIKAVQEIISGREYYRTDKAIVVTNSYFTSPAKKMAKECGVELWDRNDCQKRFRQQ